jgi:predicted nucleic acid-binding protein
MPAPEFLDTNVLVYAYDPGDSRKQRIAQDLVRRALAGDILAQLSHLEGFARAKPFRISEGYPKVFTTGEGVGDLF